MRGNAPLSLHLLSIENEAELRGLSSSVIDVLIDVVIKKDFRKYSVSAQSLYFYQIT